MSRKASQNAMKEVETCQVLVSGPVDVVVLVIKTAAKKPAFAV